MNRGAVGPFVACAVILLAPAAATRPSGRETSTPPVLRVLTYNIRHGEGLDGRFDLQRLADIMNAAGADLIALQEVDRGTRRASGVDQLAELARLTGMHAVFGKAMDYQGGSYGVGILSRTPARRVTNRRLPGSPDREPRTALTVDIDTGERYPRVQFTTTHLDQGRDLMDQVAQASYLAAGLNAGSGDAHILAGDLNTRPDTLTMQILARRWTDMFADPPPDPSGRPRRRIDYVMVQPANAWRTVEARYIDAPLASDHQPVLVALEWVGSRETR
jgi:endonuclease/exonuclease/phosphatase family metal-dependent hydrolase